MSSFRDKLVSMSKELTKYGKCDKTQLMEDYISKRLEKSVSTYYDQMFSYMEALSSYNTLKVVRRLTKLDNKKDVL